MEESSTLPTVVCPEGARLIPLWGAKAAGRFAIVSSEDYAWASALKWFLTSNGYVARNEYRDSKTIQMPMHRDIAKPEPKQWTDHLNSDRLDNRRENLRCCAAQQNNFNRQKSTRNKASQYKGIRRNARSPKVSAYIVHQGENISLGRYLLEEDAARAYDSAARYLFGEFAHTNFEGTDTRSPEELRATSDSDPRFIGRFKK